MADFTKVLIRGRLSRDPQLRYTPGGKSVCDFGIAVNEVRNGQKQPVQYFDCKCWGEFAEHMHEAYRKGDQFAGQGKLSFETWDDRTTGAKRSKVSLMLFQDSIDDEESKLRGGSGQDKSSPVRGRPAPQRQNRPSPAREPEPDEQQFQDDDIPF